MVICARRTVLLPRIIIRLVVIESVTLSGSRHRDKRGRRNRSIDRAKRRFVFRVNTERRVETVPPLCLPIKSYPKLCYPKQMGRVFFFFLLPFINSFCLPHFFIIIASSSTMFSAAQHASTATTFLTGGCANTTNAATSSSSSSRRAFFSTKRQTPKRIIIANVGKATASNVSRNPNMGQLQAGYLFPEIARIRNAHLEKNPDAKIISLGIGDTTVRFYARRTTTKSAFFFFVVVSRFYPFRLRVAKSV